MFQHTVLIVDDDPLSAASVELALNDTERFHIVTLANGALAWSWLERQSTPPAAIVTDLQMPLVDGFELIRRTRACTLFACTRIIVLSGSPDKDARARVLSLGADEFFVKPWSPARLKRRLDELLYDSTGNPASP